MKKKRKTPAERQAEHRRLTREHWPIFKAQLEKVSTMVEAEQLRRRAVPVDAPGREYYSHFGTFLVASFDPRTCGASREELVLYFDFLKRLDASGELVPGALAALEATFQCLI